jgi:hypothetical protein
VGHGGPQAEDELNGYSFAETMLFAVGRPSIMIPPAISGTTLGRRIAIARNSSRPAAPALIDALPLVEKTEHTTIITVNARSLERHRAQVDTVLCDVEHRISG